MKVIKKNVYYCEHCNKRTLSASSMKSHEKKCTANPERECKMCDGGIDLMSLVPELKARFTLEESNFDITETSNPDSHLVIWTGEPVTMKEILDLSDGCPNCTLALLRQTGMSKHYFHFEYDYKKEFSDAMRELESCRREQLGNYY